MEFYSPPYLFKTSPRPTITAAPESVGYGRTFFVETPDFESIDAVNWIRLSSVTHSFNQNQRINRLFISSRNAQGLNVVSPSNGNLSPPGHYMLFILADGVPSVAKIMRIASMRQPAFNTGLVFSTRRSQRESCLGKNPRS